MNLNDLNAKLDQWLSKIRPTSNRTLFHGMMGDIVDFIQSNVEDRYIGYISPFSDRPMPGKSGLYKFSESGFCGWLDIPQDVSAGSDVFVKFENGVYSYIYSGGSFSKIADDSLLYDEDGLRVNTEDSLLSDSKTRPASAGVVSTLNEIKASREDPELIKGVWQFLQTLTLANGLKTANFRPGLFGSGAAILNENGRTRVESDDMVLRGALTVIELLVQRVRHQGGVNVLSPGSMIVGEVSYHDTYYKLTRRDDTPMEIEAGDLVRCQTFTGGVKYYWALVLYVGEDYIYLSADDYNGLLDPAPGDNLVVMGSRTNPTRRSFIMISSVGASSPSFEAYEDIDTYSLDGKCAFSICRGGDGRFEINIARGNFQNVNIGGNSTFPRLEDEIERVAIIAGEAKQWVIALEDDNTSVPADADGVLLEGIELPSNRATLLFGGLVQEDVRWSYTVSPSGGVSLTTDPNTGEVQMAGMLPMVDVAYVYFSALVNGEEKARKKWTITKLKQLRGNETHLVQLYKRSIDPIPTAGITASLVYTFSTGVLSGDTAGWTMDIPSGYADVYCTAATAYGNQDYDTIEPHEWAEPILLYPGVPLRIEPFGSPGFQFYREGQDYRATLGVLLLRTDTDVTNEFHPSCFVWERFSGNPQGDPDWNILHLNAGNSIDITLEDLIGDTDFVVTVYDANGRMAGMKRISVNV